MKTIQRKWIILAIVLILLSIAVTILKFKMDLGISTLNNCPPDLFIDYPKTDMDRTINSSEQALDALKEYIITNKGDMTNYFGDIKGERIISKYYNYTLRDIKFMNIQGSSAWVLDDSLAINNNGTIYKRAFCP